jgi:putative oxidoreductase
VAIYPAGRVTDHLFQPEMTHTTISCEPEDSMTAYTQTTDHARIEAGALLLRLGLGSMFIAHALLKVFVFTLPGTAQFFESLGLPAALGYVTIAAEFGGGVLLVLGVYTRYVALALVPILLGATWAHLGNGWLFSAPNGGWEYPAFLTLAAIVQFFIGDGAFALRRSMRPSRARATATVTA